ncbi:MAG: hypothetical protein LKF70_10850 [Prevotella sp.]|jgi:hypothetical protein|nr:hypothetical protein [Prevotella sp.]
MRNLRITGVVAIGIITLDATATNAQDNVKSTISANLVNQYIWRGQDLGDVSVQPALGISWKGVSLSSFGNVGLSDKDDTKEFDLTGAYTFKGLNMGITDYWFNQPNKRYFCYAAHKTSHVFEANVGYNFGPLALQWYTNFAGNDGINKNGNRAYSSYVEISAPFTFATCDWNAAVGAVPYRTSFYSDVNGFAITNVSLRATKAIPITSSFTLPIYAQITANPSNEKAYFIFGFTLHP